MQACNIYPMDILMPNAFSGACACGAIHYECTARPLAMYNCHCHACQLSGGAPYSAILVVVREAVSMSGTPARYKAATSDGSDHADIAFCGTCGTPLFAMDEARPEILIIKAPTLAAADWFKPVADIWTASAQSWTSMDRHIPKVYKSPPLLQQDGGVAV